MKKRINSRVKKHRTDKPKLKSSLSEVLNKDKYTDELVSRLWNFPDRFIGGAWSGD
jgi:hypothetical protein